MPTPNHTTVLLARFDDLLGAGLRGLLDRESSVEVIAADVEPGRLSVLMRGHRPDVAVIALESFGELVEVRTLAAQHPRTHLVLIAESPTPAISAQLLAFGASACLGRDTQARDILTAIHLASRGLQVIPRGSAEPWAGGARVATQLLTRRETDVLPLLSRGLSNAQIALALGMGIETVRTHARHIYRKLGVASRRELSAAATPAPAPAPAPARLDEWTGRSRAAQPRRRNGRTRR